jgi:hypothetical protein
MNAVTVLLTTAFRHAINEPTIEAGFERFAALTRGAVPYDAFRDAVAACLRDGLIREPIRLPEGALQCHWHLELTPKGVAAARAAGQIAEDKRSVQESCTLPQLQRNNRHQNSSREPTSRRPTEPDA